MTSADDRQPARRGVATAAVALALLVAILGFFAPPVVIGDLLIPPFAVHSVLVVTALVAVSWTVTRTDRSKLPGCISTGFLCLSLASFHALWSLTTTFTILEPVSPDGCRVVARESAFLMSGNGSVGVIGRHGGPAWMKGHYFVDDGGTPIRNGSYELTWGTNGDASLRISDAYDFDPVEPDLSC
mgnify:FL=1